MTTADRNYLIKYLTVDSNHGLQEHGHGGLLWEHGEELLLAQWRPEVRRGGRRARARRAYMSSPRVLSCRRQHKSEAAKKVRTSSRYGSAGLVKYHVFSSCSPRFWGNRPSPLPAARRCCHESAAAQRARRRARAGRANIVYHANISVMKSTVDRKSNSMSKGYIRDTCGKFRSKLEACIVAQRTDLPRPCTTSARKISCPPIASVLRASVYIFLRQNTQK